MIAAVIRHSLRDRSHVLETVKKAKAQPDVEEMVEKAIERTPDFVEAHYNLGIAYQKQLKLPEMITAFQQVVKLGEPGSYTVNHAQDMLNRLEQQMRDDDGISLDDYLRGSQFFEQGFEYMLSGNWEAAITEFNSAIKITPKHPQSYGNLGICYSNMQRKQDALHAFDKAIELDPNYEPALVNRKLVESLAEGDSLTKKVKSIQVSPGGPQPPTNTL